MASRASRLVLSFVTAVVVTHVLTSFIAAQLVLADISGFGVPVSILDRLAVVAHDLFGLVPALPILIAASLGVAFVAAGLWHRYLGGPRLYWYLLAGFVALPLALELIKYGLGGTILAAARTPLGAALAGLCSGAGAWVFARLTSEPGAGA